MKSPERRRWPEYFHVPHRPTTAFQRSTMVDGCVRALPNDILRAADGSQNGTFPGFRPMRGGLKTPDRGGTQVAVGASLKS
jgi:hypothetical protein